MKNSFISLSVSALVAVALLPFSVGLIASVIAAAGVLALALGDVARDLKPLALSAIPAGKNQSVRLPFAA